MKIETIHESLVNGQREQMFSQINEYGYLFWEDYKYYLDDLFFMLPSQKYINFADAVISYFRIKYK